MESCAWRRATMVAALAIHAMICPPKVLPWWLACCGSTSSVISSAHALRIRGRAGTSSSRRRAVATSLSAASASASSLARFCRSPRRSHARWYACRSSTVSGTTGASFTFLPSGASATKMKPAEQTGRSPAAPGDSACTVTPTSMEELKAALTTPSSRTMSPTRTATDSTLKSSITSVTALRWAWRSAERHAAMSIHCNSWPNWRTPPSSQWPCEIISNVCTREEATE